MAIYGKKYVRYQSRKELHHHAVGATRETMIDVEVLFPPAEEGFNVQTQLIDAHDVFGGEIEPVEYPGFTRLKDGGDIRPFIALAVRQIDFHGDAGIEIEPTWAFALLTLPR